LPIEIAYDIPKNRRRIVSGAAIVGRKGVPKRVVGREAAIADRGRRAVERVEDVDAIQQRERMIEERPVGRRRGVIRHIEGQCIPVRLLEKLESVTFCGIVGIEGRQPLECRPLACAEYRNRKV